MNRYIVLCFVLCFSACSIFKKTPRIFTNKTNAIFIQAHIQTSGAYFPFKNAIKTKISIYQDTIIATAYPLGLELGQLTITNHNIELYNKYTNQKRTISLNHKNSFNVQTLIKSFVQKKNQQDTVYYKHLNQMYYLTNYTAVEFQNQKHKELYLPTKIFFKNIGSQTIVSESDSLIIEYKSLVSKLIDDE